MKRVEISFSSFNFDFDLYLDSRFDFRFDSFFDSFENSVVRLIARSFFDSFARFIVRSFVRSRRVQKSSIFNSNLSLQVESNEIRLNDDLESSKSNQKHAFEINIIVLKTRERLISSRQRMTQK